MFGILKDKLKKVVQSIAEKFEKKEPIVKEEKKVEEVKPEIVEEKPIEKIEKIKVEEEKEIPAVELPVEKEEKVEEEIEAPVEIKGEKVEEIKPKIGVVEETKPVEIIKKESFLKRLFKPKVEVKEEKRGIVKKVVEKVVKKVVEKKLSEEDVMPILNDLEIGLIEADVAVEVAEKIKNDLKNNLVDREIRRGTEKEVVLNSIKNSLLEILSVSNIDLTERLKQKKPFVVLFLGFNGSGKTTSLAKVGKWLIDSGHSVVFAAADTFRAAAEEQLEEHAKRIGVKVIKHRYGADPAAVIFDAVKHAEANGIDFVLADSAGRAHTNRNLMDQLQKIIKVNKPDMKILVIDSLTGNDAILQARFFNEVGIDGLIFTKVDVNEKGGAILSVTHELKKPILFLGLGQEYKDFIIFDAKDFVEKIVGM